MLQLVKKCSWCKKPIYPDREICKSCQKDYDNGLVNKNGKPNEKNNIKKWNNKWWNYIQ